MRRRAWPVAVLVTVAFVGTACGSDDNGSAASSETKAPPTYTVTAHESGDSFAYDIPKDVAGGVVTITLKSDASNKEPHDFQLLKLAEGHSVSEVVDEVGSDTVPLPTWFRSGAGVGTVAPGQSSSATFELAPNARYAFFCTESGENGSHAKHGMSGSFTTGDSSGATMPAGTATITASEYTFEASGLKAGRNTIKFVNGGTMLHHVLLVPIAPGKTFEEAKAAFLSDAPPAGPPPVLFDEVVASAVVGKGESVVYDADLQAGDYVAVCFMPDPGTAGPPHVAKGMIKELRVS